jgi:hypothetical protein
MAVKQLGRWKCSTSLIGPREGALLTGLADPIRDRSVDAAPPRRGDQAAPRRPRDQEPEPGQLLCQLAQNGTDGSWRAVDGNGRPLQVGTAPDGTLEIRHAGDGDQEDPDTIRLQSPFGDANAGGRGENAPGFEQRMAAAIAPSDRAHDRGPAGLRGLAELMRVHYRR